MAIHFCVSNPCVVCGRAAATTPGDTDASPFVEYFAETLPAMDRPDSEVERLRSVIAAAAKDSRVGLVKQISEQRIRAEAAEARLAKVEALLTCRDDDSCHCSVPVARVRAALSSPPPTSVHMNGGWS